MPGVAGCVPGCPGEVRGYGTAGGGVVGAAWEGEGVRSAWDWGRTRMLFAERAGAGGQHALAVHDAFRAVGATRNARKQHVRGL